MGQNEPRYHAAFVELARNSHIRPVRSRKGFFRTLGVIALIAFAAGLFSYVQFQRAGARSVTSAAPVVEVPLSNEELTPDAIEKMQNQLHDQPPVAGP